MSNFFLDDEEALSKKINIDELYEKKQQRDLKQLQIFNKILKKVHDKIKAEAKKDLQTCFFIVPEILLNSAKFDNAACIAYLMHTLKENGFAVRYTHPNLLIICWAHYIPSYIRNEFKKKTGIHVNEFGVVESNTSLDNEKLENINNINHNLIMKPADKDNKKEYTPINSYKPTGNLVYDEKLLDSISNKLYSK
jgi:hypothetical protein